MVYIPSTSVYISQGHFNFAAKATAVVSEPPLPRVVISPSSFIPWNPATTTIFFVSKHVLILLISMSEIRDFVWDPSVKIPAWNPVRDTESCPKSLSAMDINEVDTCSPVAINISSSLLSGFSDISLAMSIKISVVFPIAETTTTISSPFSLLLAILLAIFFIFSVVPIDVPPYFWTTFAI